MLLGSKKRKFLLLAAILALLVLTSCTAGDTDRWGLLEPAGFLAGLWHGFILLFSFVISLFDESIKVYEVFNNGGWYNFGFLFGVMIFWRSSGIPSSIIRKNRKCSDENTSHCS